jgi:hypothetical protein
MIPRLGLLSGVLCFALAAQGAETRLAADSGVLAFRPTAEAPWTVWRSEDVLPEAGEFRAGPTKPVKIPLDGGVLELAPETSGSWNRDRRALSINQGQIHLQLPENAEPWLLSRDGNEGWRVPGGTSLIWLRGDGEAWHVIAGGITAAGDDARELVAPISLIEKPDGTSATAAPSEDVEAWSKKLLRWTHSSQGPGQLIAKDAQDGSPVRLEVARYRVNVVLQPPVALVQIDESFYNPYSTQEEGTFVFNLPPGASVSRFAMFVTPGELIEGELIGRKRADEIYTSIVRRRRDPAILEQIGDNLFHMRVFPIFAQDTKRILLDYTVPLVAEHGRYRFELPLMSDLKPIWDFSVKGTIYPPVAADRIQSATHPQLKFETGDDGRVFFGVADKLVQPPPVLHLSYPALADRPATVRAFTQQVDNRQFFVATSGSCDLFRIAADQFRSEAG